jgi:hypothetical protein
MKPYVFIARCSGRLRWRFTAWLFLVNIEEDMPAGVAAIPTSVVNRQVVSGAQPNARFTPMID